MKVWRDDDQIRFETEDTEVACMSWEGAWKFAERVLDCVEAIVDDMPDPPRATMGMNEWMTMDPEERLQLGNLDLTNADGVVVYRITTQMKPIVR